uniref:c-type cytochrome biogenensis protein n=1 Tax=Madagascaria erythrocladioides TaxID=753684 RepID=UPI001BED55B7|nr:c-type cytochrome biogenensis protein [Madagascaria erythrocladioides]QUE28948.1 Ccs1 [Madagascaria erythrocladioides]UNJ16497.1 c-type cytochrome biogenensis protein [Madagascaria erythrocladioides]
MNKNIKWKLFSMLGSLRLSIFLLFGIAIVTMLGTIIEQDKTIEFYQLNYPVSTPIFGFISWKVILFFGLDHVYTNLIFYSLLVLFSCTLLICTFSKQLPMLKIARIWRFYRKKRQFHKLSSFIQFDRKAFPFFVFSLNSKGYFVFQKKQTVYGHKGLLGRVSPIIVHFSIICILFGSILSSVSGFVVQQIVPNGESFHIQNVLNAGSLSVMPQNILGKVKDFWIVYNSDGSINQFFSEIILENPYGKTVKKQTIYVNKPLRYKGLFIYQTDWNITGLKFLINNSPFQVSATPNTSKDNLHFWTVYLPNNSAFTQGSVFVISDLKGYVDIYSQDQKFITHQKIGEKFLLNGIHMQITEVITSTGLQIKADPGIPIIYLGFLLLMLSTLSSYLNYAQVWIFRDSQYSLIGGKSNRDIVKFEEDFHQIYQNLN